MRSRRAGARSAGERAAAVTIGGWQIEGFGVFHNFEVRLPSGLTVFLGPNEAGKSTLLGFLRAMLFGFPSRRSKTPQYPPLRGGRHGGRLMLCGPLGEIIVERFMPRRNGLRVNGRDDADQDLRELLGGADESVFSSVFAFSLSEMQSFEWLRADQIRERIFSAGIAGAGASARQVIEALDAEASLLLRTRGGSRARDLGERIHEAERRLKLAQADAERYVALEQEYEKWSAQAAALAAEELDLHRRHRAIEAKLELWSDCEQAREELATLEPIDEFPSEPEARLAALGRSVEAARAVVQGLEEEQSARDRSRAQLTIDEGLEKISDQVEEFHGRLTLYQDRLETLADFRQRKNYTLMWMASGAGVAFASGWLTWRGEVALGLAILIADLIAAGFLLYQRAARAAGITRLEQEVAAWEEPVRGWLASSSSGEQLVREFLDLRVRCHKAQEARSMAVSLDDARRENQARLESARRGLESAEGALHAFLKEAGAADEAEFQARLRVFRKRRELSALIRDRELRIGEPSCRSEEWTNELSGLLARLGEVQKQRDVAVGEQRVSDADRRRIAESAAVPAIQAELEWFRSELAGAVREWRVATLAKELVARTLQEFTRTRQPAVLEEASSAFSRVTAGGYERILQEEDHESLVVQDRNAQCKRPEELSRGTAEQLYLCLRLALAAEFAKRSSALPLIMDDVLVNFDPERGRAVARELAHYSGRHQVLVFTCHPETARLFTEVEPETNVILMERHGASPAKE
jgi:uncharacterized protein YhaN